MYHPQHVLDVIVMVVHIYCVQSLQIKTIFICWIVMPLQMMFEQQGVTPLNQLTNNLRHLSTDRYFSNRELFSALVHAQLN
jgi:hypothetical protein